MKTLTVSALRRLLPALLLVSFAGRAQPAGIGPASFTAPPVVNGPARVRGRSAPTGGTGDNLGNHLATQALNLQGQALIGTGASLGTAVGLGVRADGGLNLGQNTTGNNVLLGYQAGSARTTGGYNLALGYQAGQALTSGAQNTFGGYQSGYHTTTGSSNQFQGFQSGFSNTEGSLGYFSGFQSGYANTTGRNNQFSGQYSGVGNKTGSYNYFSGYSSGYLNEAGSYNTFVGFESGFNNGGSRNQFIGHTSGRANTSGSENQFSGFQSGLSNTTGSRNQFNGFGSGKANTTGANNVFVGYLTGAQNATGRANTALGSGAGPGTDSLTNATALGANAVVSQSNSLVLGGTGPDAVRVGIGTTAPASTLDVSGSEALAYATTSGTAGIFTLTAAHHTVRRLAGCTTISLPPAGTCPGRIYVLISANGSGTPVGLSVQTAGSVYDDVTNSRITALPPNARLSIQSDGIDWVVIGR